MKRTTLPLQNGADQRFFSRPITLLISVIVAVGMAAPAQARVSQSQFDSFIFQQHGTADQARSHLATVLGLEIERIELVIPLRDEQKQALRLAGQGDIHRFFNRVVGAQKEFQQLDPEKIDFSEAYEIAAPLQLELTYGLFNDQSMLAKVVRSVLNKEQLKIYRERQEVRRKRTHEIHVRTYIATLETAMPFTADQREKLIQLATSQIPPGPENHQLSMMLVAYRFSQLPKKAIAEILDKEQMEAFEKTSAEAKRIEAHLKQRGLIDAEIE